MRKATTSGVVRRQIGPRVAAGSLMGLETLQVGGSETASANRTNRHGRWLLKGVL